MADQIDRLWPLTWLRFLAGTVRFHKTYLAQIFGPPKIGPDGYPGRPMARPSAILERCWLQNYPKNGNKKWSNSDFGEIVIFATPPMRNQRFRCPGPLQKKTLQPDPPPKILNFQPQGASGWQHEPKMLPKGFLLRGAGSTKNPKKQFQKGSKVRSRTDSSKRTEFFCKWVPKCIPKAI